MKRSVLGLIALVIPGLAVAQATAPITATPLMPPGAQVPAVTLPVPGAQPAQDVPPPPSGPTPVQATWVPQGTAQLQVLDKVNAQNALLTVKVGQAAQFGTLNIAVQACSSRPPSQPQDAAAYLAITDSHADAPGFRGWLVANNPAVSMLQHPIYDVRVVGCRA